MKIKRYLNLLAVMSVFAACQNETDILDAPLKGTEVTIEAAREGVAGSRTTLTEEYKINWHESDKLSVFLGSGVNQPFTIHEGAGTDYATFKGTGDIFITGGSESGAGAFANLAYYPYSEGMQVSQGANGAYTITASLPSNQTYRQGSFGQDAYHMVAVAESNRDYAFTFKNVGSMFMLYLKGTAEITKIELESRANKLAGACTVTAAYGEEPSIALDVNSAESKITLNCMSEVEGGVTKGVQLNETESTVFVIAVPPIAGNADDLTFTIYDANHGYMVYKNAAAYSVPRNQYYTFGATTAVEYKATGYDFADDVVAWIGNNTFTSISLAVAASQANDVINVKPGTYNEVVNVKGGKNVTIQPANEGDEVTIAGIDHQSNGTPSTVVVKNITLDNTLQTEGWFTGTSQNMKPCVGAWGGNFTFEGCKFIVEGTSGKETGVMTWWTTAPALSFKFDDCEFVGYNDHASARAMQIYGNVNMEVTSCIFKTCKDYSLKYVAEEGNVATFDGNKVYNTKNFIQLGSDPYAGSKYTVKINNTTLGDGVNHYCIDNDENQMVYIDGALVVSTAGQLAACLTGDEQNIKVVLANDIELPITSLGTITAGSGEYKLGGESTETIMIDLNNNKLNITTTYWSAIGAKNNDATITIKDGTMTSTGNSADTWNAWDVRFSNCNYVIENVIFEKAVALDNAGKSATLKGVTIKDNHNTDTYALWITAEGQIVTLEDNCVINMLECTDGRGIKIDEQYVDSPQKVTLKVSNTTFSTEEKSAILVKSAAGAEITLDNINIENVTADNVNAVWCDADAAGYNDLITVAGGTKKVEGQ